MVDKPHLVHDYEQRNHRDLRGNHHCRQIHTQQKAGALKPYFCEGVCRQRGGKQRDHRIAHGNKQAVEDGLKKREAFKHCCICIQRRLCRNPLDGNGHKRPAAFQRGGYHPEKRHQCDKCKQNGHSIIAKRAPCVFTSHSSPTSFALSSG